jgi:3-phosphoglycerate kinase
VLSFKYVDRQFVEPCDPTEKKLKTTVVLPCDLEANNNEKHDDESDVENDIISTELVSAGDSSSDTYISSISSTSTSASNSEALWKREADVQEL